MKLVVNGLRNLIGGILVIFDIITRGPKLKRSTEVQKEVDQASKELTLYQFFACPFCIKTRRTIYKLNLNLEKRSVSEGSPYRQELLEQGGKIQAPCLKIEKDGNVEWMYESKTISQYLKQRFA